MCAEEDANTKLHNGNNVMSFLLFLKGLANALYLDVPTTQVICYHIGTT